MSASGAILLALTGVYAAACMWAWEHVRRIRRDRAIDHVRDSLSTLQRLEVDEIINGRA